MPPFARRFRTTTGAVVALVTVLCAAVIVVVVVVLQPREPVVNLALAGVALALVALGVIATGTSVRRALALRRMTRDHPDGLVFLARRQPAVVSDLAHYLYSHDLDVDLADRWVVALVDHRGISAWSIDRTPAEMLLMPWDELGAIEVTDLDSGDRGVEVDVRPAQSPLVAAIGYAAFGLTASLNRAGVAEVAAGTNALRPAGQAASSGSDG
jgi:hypothetical protein